MRSVFLLLFACISLVSAKKAIIIFASHTAEGNCVTVANQIRTELEKHVDEVVVRQISSTFENMTSIPWFFSSMWHCQFIHMHSTNFFCLSR